MQFLLDLDFKTVKVDLCAIFHNMSNIAVVWLLQISLISFNNILINIILQALNDPKIASSTLLHSALSTNTSWGQHNYCFPIRLALIK